MNARFTRPDTPMPDLLAQVKDLPLIGRGMFTRCYRYSKKEALCISCDPTKECIALGWTPTSRFIPEIEKLDYDGIFSLYKMPLYEKPKSLKGSLNKSDYRFYSDLRNLKVDYDLNSHRWIYNIVRAVEQSKLHYARKDLMISFAESMANFGHELRFEISPRNVAVKNGKLILLDVFFFADKMRAVRAGKLKI